MKRIVLSILCLTLILTLFAGCKDSTVTFNGSGKTETTIKLRIVTMEGEKLFDNKVKVIDEKPTVYMALKAAADAEKLTLEIKDESDPAKMFLNAINDLKSANPNFWMYYINKKAAEAGIGTQALKSDDVVEFIYGDYNKGYVEIK